MIMIYFVYENSNSYFSKQTNWRIN